MTGVWIVVLNWNGCTDTLELLAGLRRVDATVLVVDNGSTDGTLDEVAEIYPEVRTLQTGANLGFAGGNNRGIEHAIESGAQIVIVLNNDTLVEPGFLEPLVAAIEQVPLRAASPDIRYATDPGQSWFRGGSVDLSLGIPRHDSAQEAGTASHGTFPSQLLTGCCIGASVGTWRRVGLFDERMFLIFEDSDWSMRATALGVDLVVARDSRIRHKVSRSFHGPSAALGTYYFTRNGLIFASRYLGVQGTFRFVVHHIVRPSIGDLRASRGRRTVLLRMVAILAAATGRRGQAGRWTHILASARRASRSGSRSLNR